MASRQITLVQSLFSGIEDVSVSSLSWKAVPLEMFFSGFLHQPCFLSACVLQSLCPISFGSTCQCRDRCPPGTLLGGKRVEIEVPKTLESLMDNFCFPFF